MTQLTPQETNVLRHMLGGYSNKQIARILRVSDRTIETHRLNLRRKIKAETKRDLILFSREHGIQAV